MKIPDSVTVNTGEQNNEYRKIEEFFNSVIKEEIKLPSSHPTLEKRVMGMYKLDNGIRLDEYVHMLSYKEQIIAAVLETRTNLNYIHFDYFLNLPKKSL